MSFVRDNMAPLMFGGMILFMLIGYPAAFSLAATGLFFGFLGVELGLIRADFLGNLTYQLFGIVSNELLLAIPFFTFMGAVLERSRLAEDLLDSIGQLFGPVRGGLSYAVIIVGAILGAITGTVAASVIAMGVIAMQPMLRHGYSMRHTMGVIAASGTITQLIPPSLVLIVLADQLGRSVGDMYAGAIGPSLIQIALFSAFVFVVSIIRPKAVPAMPREARTLEGWALAAKCLRGIVPSLEDELPAMVEWAHGRGMDLTLIEVMPLGDVGEGRLDQYLPLSMVRARLSERFTLEDIDYRTGGPARYTRVQETGGRLGFITPLTHNFCESCNRVRITCTGTLFMCLGQEDAADLRAPLRASEGNELLYRAIDEAILRKPKGHDFVIDRRHKRPALHRHMSVTGG